MFTPTSNKATLNISPNLKARNLGSHDRLSIGWRSGDPPNERALPSNVPSQDSEWQLERTLSLGKKTRTTTWLGLYFSQFIVFLGSSPGKAFFSRIFLDCVLEGHWMIHNIRPSSSLSLLCPSRKLGTLFYAFSYSLLIQAVGTPGRNSLKTKCGLKKLFDFPQKPVQIALPLYPRVLLRYVFLPLHTYG